MSRARIEMDLPFPPSLNHYYRRWGDKTLISRTGRLFRQRICELLATDGIREMTGPLRIVIHLYPPDRRRRDIDNSLKALLDALQHGGAYRDDSQIVKLEIEKHEPVPGGKTTIRIQAYGRRDEART